MAGTAIISFTLNMETDSELRKYAKENNLTVSMAVRTIVSNALAQTRTEGSATNEQV